MQKYSNGLVVGKFMPLHTGHIFLLETAARQCQKLTVLVFTRPDEPIPGELRVQWVKEQFPQVSVVHHSTPLPRDRNQSAHWDVWKSSIETHCQGIIFDAVFSSEAYGQRLADDLHAKHVEVDRLRSMYPVSGTDVRSDPGAYREFIPEVVRPYYEDQLSGL